MVSFVEGEWKNFEFRMIKPADYPKVLDHLHKCFYLSTPLTEALTYSKEYFDEFDKIYLEVLPQNLSFFALDKDTNEIAGARITFVQDKKLEEKFASFGFKTKQMEIMNLIMGTVNRESRVYEKFGITSFVNFYTACVDNKYKGQGLATEMYNRALPFIKANKSYTLVKSNLTSPYTRRICVKFGFQELSRAYYNDFKDENGNPLLSGKNDDEFVSFMCLPLK